MSNSPAIMNIVAQSCSELTALKKCCVKYDFRNLQITFKLCEATVYYLRQYSTLPSLGPNNVTTRVNYPSTTLLHCYIVHLMKITIAVKSDQLF